MSTDKMREEPSLAPAAWAVMAFGRLQKLVVRADVADELTCKFRESDPDATAVPLFTWPAVIKESLTPPDADLIAHCSRYSNSVEALRAWIQEHK